MLLAAAKAQSAPEKVRPAKTADTQASQPEGRLSAQSGKPTEADLQVINDGLQMTNSNLKFQVDKTTGITYFKVVDSNTGDTIRQVPSEEILTMARKLRELSKHEDASGVIMDKEG